MENCKYVYVLFTSQIFVTNQYQFIRKKHSLIKIRNKFSIVKRTFREIFLTLWIHDHRCMQDWALNWHGENLHLVIRTYFWVLILTVYSFLLTQSSYEYPLIIYLQILLHVLLPNNDRLHQVEYYLRGWQKIKTT
jgi:hypothetical protein